MLSHAFSTVRPFTSTTIENYVSCKSIFEGHNRFTMNKNLNIELDVHGSMAKEILEVYELYASLFVLLEKF